MLIQYYSDKTIQLHMFENNPASHLIYASVSKLLYFDSKGRVSCWEVSKFRDSDMNEQRLFRQATMARRRCNERRNIHEARMRRRMTRKILTQRPATAHYARIERTNALSVDNPRARIYFFSYHVFPQPISKSSLRSTNVEKQAF